MVFGNAASRAGSAGCGGTFWPQPFVFKMNYIASPAKHDLTIFDIGRPIATEATQPALADIIV
jgi:hypothetical protein